MPSVEALTVTVAFDFTLNGQPIVTMLKAPATTELHEKHSGLTVHLALDGDQLAQALLPHLLAAQRANPT